MNKWVKGTSLAIAVLALAGIVALYAGQALGERKMARKIAVDVAPLNLVRDAAHVERGRYLFGTRGCATCHGAGGAGAVVIESGPMLVVSPNLTAGANSATAHYGTQDWVRTLRHGVKPDGTPVMIMPSEDYSRLTDDDVSAIIAYVLQLPPLAGRSAQVRLPPTVKAMYGFGAMRDAAEVIDHTLAPPVPVAAMVTPEHGAYIATSCIGCHGAQMSGGRIPGAPMEWPEPANLTPGAGSAMKRYPTPEAFMAMLHSGRRPDGTPISPLMPYQTLRDMSEVDMRALHAYLQTLPPRAAGKR